MCQSKEILRCNVIEKFANDTKDDDYGHKKFWKLVNQILPRAGLILHEHKYIHPDQLHIK
jgi:hypothetical protein